MRCLNGMRKRTYTVWCCKVAGSTLAKLIDRAFKLLKSVLARCLYCLYTILAIWRVVEALQIDTYWLLLLALLPLGLETLNTVFFNGSKANKW